MYVMKEEDIQFLYNENTAKQSDNIMDNWIQSFTQSLIQFFKAEMDGETSWSLLFCSIIDAISGL